MAVGERFQKRDEGVFFRVGQSEVADAIGRHVGRDFRRRPASFGAVARVVEMDDVFQRLAAASRWMTR